jgi:Ser/Thr protein kinase RdoA (MazF antagonist)
VIDAAAARRAAERFAPSTVSVRPVATGHINDTFVVERAGGDLVLQRVNTAVLTDLDGITANIATLRHHLGARRAGSLVPEPFPTPAGDLLVHDANGSWRAWLAVGADTVSPAPAPAVVASAATLLGRFHAAVADLDPGTIIETLPRFHDLRRRRHDLEAMVEADPLHRAATVDDEIALARAAAPLVERAADLQQRVPQRVAHNDAKFDNFLFRDGAAVCLVDLDTIMPGAWFFDIGDFLRSATTAAAEDTPDPDLAVVDPALYQAALAGYRLGVDAALAPVEAGALDVAGAIVAYEQAVRFLTDWLAGDVYYRTTRPAHNRDRARAQMRLLTTMPGSPFSA